MSSLNETYLKMACIPIRYQKDEALRPCQSDRLAFKELRTINENIKEFVANGENLLLCSNYCGNGKTTSAIKLLKSYINSINAKYDNPPALYINVPSFLNQKKLAISDKSLLPHVLKMEKDIIKSKLVVFDDIGDKDLKEFDMNSLYYWIDTRTSNLLSCIYTSNQSPRGLSNSLSGKIYSRVVNLSRIIEFSDQNDHRKAGKNYSSTSSSN